MLHYVNLVWLAKLIALPSQPYQALGGIHLLGGCQRVQVRENRIDGGAGHGITLGGVIEPAAPPASSEDAVKPQPTVTLDRNVMVGYVHDRAENGLAGISLSVLAEGDVVASALSGSQGDFTMRVAAGSYTIAVEPPYQIDEIREAEFKNEPIHVVVVAAVAPAPEEDRAFLEEIAIIENDIRRMALSGIGFRRFADAPALAANTLASQNPISLVVPVDLIRTCNLVRLLEIRGNLLAGNLLAIFDESMRQQALSIGQGGISLALVESSILSDNTIRDNGRSASDPVCGLFVGYGEDVEIRDNQIAGNGPLTTDYDKTRAEGLRGAIFVRFAAARRLSARTDPSQAPALRIANNRLDQPAGRALTAFAFGPVSCVGNSLNSEREGRWSSFDVVAGTVLILNLGGLHRQLLFKSAQNVAQRRFLASATDLGAGDQAFDNPALLDVVGALGDNSFQNIQLSELLLPGGETLFNSNQVRMGPSHRAVLSQILLTFDDLGFDGNQSSVFRPDPELGNTFALGLTLRVTDNRFREPSPADFLSLLSVAFGLTPIAATMAMNTTAHNQGDHCIFPLSNAPSGGLPVVDDNNLEFFRNLCRKFASEPAGFLRQLLNRSIARIEPATDVTGLVDTPVTEIARPTILATVDAIHTLGARRNVALAAQASRLEARFGATYPQTAAARDELAGRSQSLDQLALQGQLAGLREVEPPTNGRVLDGRVADASSFGQGGLTVGLVNADGTSLGVTARTDPSGYFAAPVSDEQLKRLQGERPFLRVLDAQGREVFRTDQPVDVSSGAPLRVVVVLPTEVPRARPSSPAARSTTAATPRPPVARPPPPWKTSAASVPSPPASSARPASPTSKPSCVPPPPVSSRSPASMSM